MNKDLFDKIKKSVLLELQDKSNQISELSYNDFAASINDYNQEEDPHGVVMYKMFFIDENSLNHTLKTLF